MIWPTASSAYLMSGARFIWMSPRMAASASLERSKVSLARTRARVGSIPLPVSRNTARASRASHSSGSVPGSLLLRGAVREQIQELLPQVLLRRQHRHERTPEAAAGRPDTARGVHEDEFAGAREGRDLRVGADKKALEQEWRVGPGLVECRYEHPRDQITDRDLLIEGEGRVRPRYPILKLLSLSRHRFPRPCRPWKPLRQGGLLRTALIDPR